MPCGCEDLKYNMKFIGWKDGVLIRGAPSLPQGTIRENFLEYADLPHWELVDPIPEIKKVPQSEESVYDEVEEVKTEVEVEVEVEEIDRMTVKTLKLFIEQQGGTVDRKWLKADLVAEARRLEEARREEVIELPPIELEPTSTDFTGEVLIVKVDPEKEPEEEPEEELDLTTPLEIPEPETVTRAYPEPEEPPDEIAGKITEDSTEIPE